jgi:uroporphyrinogen decarboxylase
MSIRWEINMTSRERVKRALDFEEVDRLPRQLWTLPGINMFRREELKKFQEMFPNDFGGPSARYGRSGREIGGQGSVGTYVDSWGCTWHAAEPGVAGEVRDFQLADWSALDHYKLPWELLDQADFSKVAETVAATDRFVIAGTETRPFERMQFLRGTENLFMDLAYGTHEVYRLRDMLHEFFTREMEMWAKTDVDGVSFMDDWGAQHALLISPAIWREFYKPLYKDYCDILRKAGKYVFFHSDGNIEAIYPDLVEIGVNAVNSQLFCMNIEELGRKYAGKICFWGEMDRQHLMPFGRPDEIRAAVHRVADAVMPAGKRTGTVAQCEWGLRDPMENVIACFDEWNRI